MDYIEIIGASEGNLKQISLRIPKNKLVVFTGLSGSGKSTLLNDVLFQECQRQYLEAMSLEGIHKPKVEKIRGASPAILVTQNDANRNPRSTVGTQTDVYTDLRMIYEKLGLCRCPSCGSLISSANCKEETRKIGNDFFVSIYCCECGHKMDKLTRTHFSFNTKEGACHTCEGLGHTHTIKKETVLDETKALEDGAVTYWEKQYGKYQIQVLYAAYTHYGIPIPKGIPVKEFDEVQRAVLEDGIDCPVIKKRYPQITPPKNTAKGRFAGIYPILWRRLSDKEGDISQLETYFQVTECPECHGERLSEAGRSVTVAGTRLPQLAGYSLEKLYQWVLDLETSLPSAHKELVEAYLRDIQTKLLHYLRAGLGYLTLDRQIITLSGGELQRLRLAAVLDCELSGIIYLLDEPTLGLHPKDTAGLATVLLELRDLGNTVLVIEHDPDLMARADYLIDMGPGSGRYGGEITAAGTLEEIKKEKASVTGAWLRCPPPPRSHFREKSGVISIKNASKYNLQDISVDIPLGCLTAVTGPSGSGKSTLLFEELAKMPSQNQPAESPLHRIVEIRQSPLTKMRRSNTATYTGIYTKIRAFFAKTDAARASGLTAKHFSFNTPGGRCENCEGLGYVNSHMLFFTDTQVLCPVCKGRRFHDDVLSVKYQGYSIHDVLKLSIEEASELFVSYPKLLEPLQLLKDVGLGYLELGQPLTTLSGGELQRLKLARELLDCDPNRPALYLMDEPTAGLHPKDVEHFLALLDRMVDAGNTVVVAEHNQQLIQNSDWVIDLGPDGGEKGGRVIFTGTPVGLAKDKRSITGQYLK
ncbi:MAG: ABC-ATPase UvrA [Blautia sp.]|jgi:excinuclease ABC subunit A